MSRDSPRRGHPIGTASAEVGIVWDFQGILQSGDYVRAAAQVGSLHNHLDCHLQLKEIWAWSILGFFAPGSPW